MLVDFELIERARSGDDGAFNQVVQAYRKRIAEETRRTKIKETVGALLGKISEEDRILLTLKEVEGLSLKELEKIYRVNENALKVRLFRARQRVLKAYESG